MDLGLLRTFLTVVDCGSLTEAANRLGLSQPAVSRQLDRLEEAIGAKLLVRRHNATQLTTAGEQARVYAMEILARTEALRQRIQETGEQVAGPLRIVASWTPGEFLAPGLVSQFSQQFPQVEPSIRIEESAAVVAGLLDRDADIGFTGTSIPHPKLTQLVVARDEMVLLVPTSHPFAERKTISIPELAGQPVIERQGDTHTVLTLMRTLRKRGFEPPAYRVVMVVNSTQAIVSAIQRGYGIGFVSSLALEDLPPRRVRVVRLEELQIRRLIYMVHLRDGGFPPQVSEFIAFVRRVTAAARRRAQTDEPIAGDFG